MPCWEGVERWAGVPAGRAAVLFTRADGSALDGHAGALPGDPTAGDLGGPSAAGEL
jgi:hypothetical protein